MAPQLVANRAGPAKCTTLASSPLLLRPFTSLPLRQMSLQCPHQLLTVAAASSMRIAAVTDVSWSVTSGPRLHQTPNPLSRDRGRRRRLELVIKQQDVSQRQLGNYLNFPCLSPANAANEQSQPELCPCKGISHQVANQEGERPCCGAAHRKVRLVCVRQEVWSGRRH